MSRILDRYLFLEFIPPYVISIALFTFLFVMSRILDITDYIINYQVGAGSVILLMIYNIVPFSLQFVVPLSVMLSILLTFLRMSGDMEITALKAGGISIYRFLPPVLLFAFFSSLLTAFISIVALPHGRMASKELLIEMAARHVDVALKPGRFIDSFKGIVLYINDVDPASKVLKDIFIEDRQTENIVSTVIAPRGMLFELPRHAGVNLRLHEGSIHQVDLSEGTAHTLRFDTYDIRLDVRRNKDARPSQRKNEEEMSLSELSRYLQETEKKDYRYYKAQMEWHKKFYLPVACIVLAVLAVPLGIQARSAKRGYGVGLGMIFFFLYYILLAFGWVFGEAGIYPPRIGMWVPNAVMTFLGLLFLTRAAKEKPSLLPPAGLWLRSLISRLRIR